MPHFFEIKISWISWNSSEVDCLFEIYRYGRASAGKKPTGVHPFDSSQGDSITNQYFMGGDCK